jgi:hypothetical protein
MKASAALTMLIMVVVFSALALPTLVDSEPSVGVKEGDWMEYNVSIAGTPPPIHNVTWMRMQILTVDGSAFPVNLTVRYFNGTVFSSMWKFNFTAGNDEGWLIIPQNLSPGDNFYDAYSKTNQNITIQSQQQQTVLGASRTVTFGSQSNRYKEWDKATGVFVASNETFKGWSASVNMVATNLWSQDSPQHQPVLFAMVLACLVGAAVLTTAVLVTQKKRRKNV